MPIPVAEVTLVEGKPSRNSFYILSLYPLYCKDEFDFQPGKCIKQEATYH